MKVKFGRIFHYLWPHMRKHPWAFTLVFLGYGTGVFFDDIVKPLIYKRLIDLFASDMPKDLIVNEALQVFFLMCGVVVAFNIGYRTGDFANARLQSKVMKRLYDFTFNNLLSHSYHFFSNNFAGSLVAKTRRFVRAYETLMDVVSFQIWFSVVSVLGVISVLFFQVRIFSYIFMGWSLVYVLVSFLFIRKKVNYDAMEAGADSLVSGRLSDSITNILNIKIFSRGKGELDEFMDITGDEERKRRRAWNFGNLQNVVQAALMGILQLVIVYIGIGLWQRGLMTLGTFALLQAYMLNLFGFLWMLGHSLTRAAKSLTEMQEVVDIFDTPSDILDAEKPAKLAIRDGHIVFENVSFGYKGGNNVLESFSLDIKPGERVGLVGHSGAGKSTITKLLLRFADIQAGSIEIDGQDIRNLTQDDLRSAISYVPQEPILFHRSIGENIAYALPGATKEQVEEVSKKAFAHEFISKFKLGYETMVGERGVKLSGGERQRIAIARAMLKNSPVIVLDEATSSLDSVSEAHIQKALQELMKGKTTIVVAHRLSTIQKMDRIVVLENGRIAEMGNHDELLGKKGIYADLWSHQSGGFLGE